MSQAGLPPAAAPRSRFALRHSTRTRALWYAVLILQAVIVIYPMFWMLTTSLKDSWSIFKSPWALPTSPQWANYATAWAKGGLGHKFLNSLAVAGGALVAILGVASMAAYVLARFAFPGNRLIYYSFIGGMALPAFLGIVPLFMLMTKLGLLDTRPGLAIVYVAYSLPLTVFVLAGFFRTLPHELAEAAVIDGCSPFGVFWSVMLPLAKPGLATAGTFVFLGLWNEYPLALVLISSDNAQTLPLGIANLTMTQKYQADWGTLFAGLVISVAPTVVLYTIFQRQVQEGITAGAVKG